MHVGWSAILAAPGQHDGPTLQALHDRVAERLDGLPWCRWRLQSAPLGLSEPRWVEDRNFDLAAHVRALAEPDAPVSAERFAQLRDALLSEPLDLTRAPWQICLIPRLEDGHVALLGKIHHSLVDGIAALQIVNLVLDSPPDPDGIRPSALSTSGEQGRAGWAIDELGHAARGGIGALRLTADAARHPSRTARSVIRDGRRLLAAARTDLLPRAPDSPLNTSISAQRTLVGYRAAREDLRNARTAGGTLNEIGLTMVAGGLRTLAMRSGESPPAPLKAMVPVSMRRADEIGPGNRISMVYIRLPVELESAADRLAAVREQMHALKASGRPEGTETLYAVGSLVPTPLRTPVVKALASPRVFNLTISQSPGPRGAIHVLGREVEEVYSVVPTADRHALAIGMVRYRRELFIGCYANPDAFPGVRQLPELFDAELHALAAAGAQRTAAGTR
jgi:WS/DGAT/MGAT family acyltransferase